MITQKLSVVVGLLVVLVGVPGAVSGQEFRRGDVEGDGVITVADAEFVRRFLIGGRSVSCQDAADANDDGSITIGDVLDIFRSVFGLDGVSLDGECGDDTTADFLECDAYGACPDAPPLLTDPQHRLWIPEVSASVGEPVVVPVYYDNLTVESLVSYSFGVAHDETIAQAIEIEFGAALLGLQFGPFFFYQEIVPGGWVAGAILQSYGTVDLLDPGVDLELYRATYELVDDATTPLELTGELGSPPVALRTLLLGPGPKLPSIQNGSLSPAMFSRGDANADGNYDLADPIFQLSALFSDGAQPPCADAADTNDDGVFDLGDPIASLFGVFGELPPPAPGPFGCGSDPTPDSLGCASFGACP